MVRATNQEPKIRVAIVDDVPETVDVTSRICRTDPKIEIVATGSDGPDAIRIFDDVAPDVLIMCVLMPKMDGITATREILSRHPDATVIILTATLPEQSRERAIESGAFAYISKPPSGQMLLETIRSAAAKA